MPTPRKCPDIFAGRLTGEDNPVGNTKTEGVDVSILETLRPRTECLHGRGLIALYGHGHPLKHLL
jgi:hypothetical protein